MNHPSADVTTYHLALFVPFNMPVYHDGRIHIYGYVLALFPNERKPNSIVPL